MTLALFMKLSSSIILTSTVRPQLRAHGSRWNPFLQAPKQTGVNRHTRPVLFERQFNTVL